MRGERERTTVTATASALLHHRGVGEDNSIVVAPELSCRRRRRVVVKHDARVQTQSRAQNAFTLVFVLRVPRVLQVRVRVHTRGGLPVPVLFPSH